MNSSLDLIENQSKRRNFLKTTLLAGLGIYSPATKAYIKDEEELNLNKENSITILITSDIHAQLNSHDEFFWRNNQPNFQQRGGLAVLKTMIESLRKQNPDNTILYDGGDFFHGHAISTFTEGEALIPIFNQLGYDLMLPGNWEVVYKKKKMLFDMGHTNAAKICANMWHDTKDEQNNELVYPPYWIKFIGGTKIGFIGYTDHLIPKRQAPAFSEGLRFEHPERNIAKYIKILRESEGCSVVMVCTHIGLAQQVGLANNPATEGADFIIGADTHERLRKPIIGKYAKVVECGAFGSFLGKLDLVVENNQLKSYTYQLLDVVPTKYKKDKVTQNLIDRAYEPYQNDLSKIIGWSKTPLMRYFVMETPMDNLITDAIKWKFKSDIAVSNGFRFCQPLSTPNPENKLIPITKEFLWNMLPLDSEAKIGYITGKQISDWLERELQNAFAKDPSKRFGGWFVRFSGLEVNFTINKDFGKRVNSIKIGGFPIELDKQYSIVACEREGDPNDTLCRIDNVKNPKNLKIMLHDVVEEYLKIHSPVMPQLEKRATATDEPHTLLTQLKGYDYEFM